MEVSHLIDLKEQRKRDRREQFLQAFNKGNGSKKIRPENEPEKESFLCKESIENEANDNTLESSDDVSNNALEYPTWVNKKLKYLDNVHIEEEYIIEDATFDTENKSEEINKKKKTRFSNLHLDFQDESLEGKKVERIQDNADADADEFNNKYLNYEILSAKPPNLSNLPEGFFEDNSKESIIYGTSVKNIKSTKESLDRSLREFDKEINLIEDEITENQSSTIEEERQENKEHLLRLSQFVDNIKSKCKDIGKTSASVPPLEKIEHDSDSEESNSEYITDIMDQVWRHRGINDIFK